MDANGQARGTLVPITGLVHGVRVRGLLPAEFGRYLLPARGRGLAPARTVAASFRWADPPPAPAPLWVGEPRGPQHRGRFEVARLSDAIALSVVAEGSGSFRLAPRSIDVRWTPGSPGAAHYFFTYALPLWLETHQVPVLHASAVALHRRAVALLGPSGVGKSTLAAGLARLGAELVADDGLALRRGADGVWRCFHGPPLIRLWPSALEQRLGIAAEGLPRVHEAIEKRWMSAPVTEAAPAAGLELAAIYLLRRSGGSQGPARTTPCAPRESLARLLEHGVAAAPTAALGMSAARLELLAGVAERVPTRTLELPATADAAVRVRAAIAVDLGE